MPPCLFFLMNPFDHLFLYGASEGQHYEITFDHPHVSLLLLLLLELWRKSIYLMNNLKLTKIKLNDNKKESTSKR